MKPGRIRTTNAVVGIAQLSLKIQQPALVGDNDRLCSEQ